MSALFVPGVSARVPGPSPGAADGAGLSRRRERRGCGAKAPINTSYLVDDYIR